MRLNIKPLRDRIVVLQDEYATIGAGWTGEPLIVANSNGVVDSQKQMGRRGTVIAVSDDIDQDQLKPGNRVMYGEFEYPTYRENGIIYQLLSDQDIVGVIE